MFSGDPRELFSQFFGPGSNPFDDLMGGFFTGGAQGGTGGPSPGSFSFNTGPGGASFFKSSGGHGMEGMDFTEFGGLSGAGGGQQDPPLEHKLNLSLEELYTGCTKKMKINHKVLAADNVTASQEDKILEINVKPGWKAGTKIRFEKEGDQRPGRIPADIVFVVQERPHSLFKREGNDLKHKARISLKQALCGGKIKVPTINGRKVSLPLNEVITPETVEVVAGEGMPVSKELGKHGNLIVGFDIHFPRTLSSDVKQKLTELLPD